MYISSFHIDGFGIFSNTGAENLPPGMVIFFGKNEAGKSTCLEFLRTMLFGYAAKGRLKRYAEPFRGGRPGGSMILRLPGQNRWPEEIRLARQPGKGHKGLALYDALGQPISAEILDEVYSGVTEKVYRAVYGFSLSELESFSSLDEDGVKNALLSASFGEGITPPGQVMKALADKQGALFQQTGKRGEMYRLLEELNSLNGRINILAGQVEQYDADALSLEETRSRLQEIRSTRKNLESERRGLERRHGVWRQWNEWRLCGMRLEAMPIRAAADFPEDAVLLLRDLEKERYSLEQQIAEYGAKIAGTSDQKKSFIIDDRLADNLLKLRRLAERKSGYRQAFSQLPVDEENCRRCERELESSLAQLGPGWTCERIRNTNRSLFAKENLEKQAREMAAAASAHQACVDMLERANRDVETCSRAVAAARETLEAMPETTAVLPDNEREELRRNMARLDESIRLEPMRKRTLAEARTAFMRAFEKLRFALPDASRQPIALDAGELAEDVREAEREDSRVETAHNLLEALLARQDEALALAAEVTGSMRARVEVEKALAKTEAEGEALRHKMDEMRKRLRETAGPGRAALDDRAAALRSLRKLAGKMDMEQERLNELQGRLTGQTAPRSVKSVPLLAIGGILMVFGLAIVIAHWFFQINDIPLTSSISWPVNLWSGYLVLAAGVGFLAGGLPRSGPEARQFAEEMAQLQKRSEDCSLHLAELGEQSRILCEKAQVDSADPITLDATEVMLEREREDCFHEEQVAREMGGLQGELEAIRLRIDKLSKEAHAREQEEQQFRRRWHDMMQTLRVATVPSAESADTFFARAETALLAYAGVNNANTELNQVWDDMHNLEARIASLPQIEDILQNSPEPVGLAEAVARILEACREADAYQDQRIQATANLQNQQATLTRAQTVQQETIAELKVAEGRLEQSRSNWNQSVSILGLGDDLNPETVREAFKCMENCLQMDLRLQGLRKEQEKNRNELLELEKPLAEIMRALDMPVDNNETNPQDWLATLDGLLARAETMEENRSAVRRLDIQLVREQDELRGLQARLDTLLGEENTLFANAGAKNADEFLQLAHARLEELDLRKNITSLLDTLRLAAGKQPLEEFLASFEESSEEGMQKRLDEIAEELDKCIETEETLAATQAKLDANVSNLLNSGELASLRGRKSGLLEKIEDVAREWSTEALARGIVLEAKNVFERERQPEIVEIASRLFASITNGNWQGLNISMEHSSLMILSKKGEPVSPDCLSRGTQEQAYLALRLAYIIEHSRHKEALPIIMDEILVNFDPERAKRAAKTISTIVDGPSRQQLFYFTCQPATVEMFSEVSPGAVIYNVEDGHIRPG